MRNPNLRAKYPHEVAAFLAFALLAGTGEVPFFQVRLATPYEDKRQGTDLFLYRRSEGRRTKRLRLDVTAGFYAAEKKDCRNDLLRQEVRAGKRKRFYDVKVVEFPGALPDPRTDPCFVDASDRLLTFKPVALSSQDVCPRHRDKCSLVEKLFDVGWQMTWLLPLDYQPRS